MAPLSGGQARTLPAKWRRYPDGRRYTYTLHGLKIGGKKHFSYKIYGFAINRIYKKTLGFSVGVKVAEKLCYECENKSRCQ